MYVPPAFAEQRVDVLQGAMRRTGLANLITLGMSGGVAGLMASPLPMLLDAGDGPYGTLYGHLARANPQWREVSGVDGLAIFMGPDAYVSPGWYPTKQETGKVVPTWNYITVHAGGPVSFFEDATELLDAVTRLTEQHEAGQAAPWAVGDAPAPFVAGQLKGIVGFRMPIRTLQGKWKLSQNRNAADRAGVAAGMAADGVGMAGLIGVD